jgi:Ferrochelatase
MRCSVAAAGAIAVATCSTGAHSFMLPSAHRSLAMTRSHQQHSECTARCGVRQRPSYLRMAASAHGDSAGKTVAAAATAVAAGSPLPALVSPFEQTAKVGVLLLNLGGPERAEDVAPFLYNLFADPDIIRLPPLLSVFQAPIAKFIAARRAPKSKKAYEAIGGGSPIVKWTRAQAEGIEQGLRRRGVEGMYQVLVQVLDVG